MYRLLSGWFTPSGLAMRGLVCIGGFLVVHALGLASTLSILSLTPTSERDIGVGMVLGMILYVLTWILASVGGPVLLLGAGLLAVWNRVCR